MKFLLKNIFVLGFALGLVSVFSNGAMADEKDNLEEDTEFLFEVLDGSRVYYDENDNFVGIDERDLEELKGTEYEYIIDTLREEGLLYTASVFRAVNPQDQLREEMLNVGGNAADREAHAQCMIDKMGGNVIDSLVTAIVNDFSAGDVKSLISNLGRAGISATVPGMVITVVQCSVET